MPKITTSFNFAPRRMRPYRNKDPIIYWSEFHIWLNCYTISYVRSQRETNDKISSTSISSFMRLVTNAKLNEVKRRPILDSSTVAKNPRMIR